MSISLLFFSFSFLLYLTTVFDALIEKKKKRNRNNDSSDNNDNNNNKKKRSLRSRILNVYVLINIALFIYNNEKTFIIMIKI